MRGDGTRRITTLVFFYVLPLSFYGLSRAIRYIPAKLLMGGQEFPSTDQIDIESFERLGSLMPQKMPGGDLCAKYPARMLASILDSCESFTRDEVIKLLKEDYVDY